MMKKQPSGPVEKVKEALVQRPTGVPVPPADVSESFRRARSSIADITADLQELRKRAPGAVKRARHAKSK